MNLFFDLPLEAGDDLFYAVIEIPKKSRVKYEYSESHSCLMVDRIFRTPVEYPQNYGFFPRTWNRFDRDPMDVIVIANESFVPGVAVPVRVIGMIEMDDTGEADHKILAVPSGYSDFSHVSDLPELDGEVLANLEWFLANYKSREKGKNVKVLGTKNKKDALKFLHECAAEFQKNHGGKH